MSKTFFSIRRNFAPDAVNLDIDYSLDEVPDPNIWFKPERAPKSFLSRFVYKVSGKKLEDMLANPLGWHIFSNRIATVLKSASNVADLEFVPLPDTLIKRNPVLSGYSVLGVKKWVECVDTSASNILWTTTLGRKHIFSFRKCVLKNAAIPGDTDVFVLAEYPVMAVLSSELADRISELRPTGFVYESIESV